MFTKELVTLGDLNQKRQKFLIAKRRIRQWDLDAHRILGKHMKGKA